MHTPYSRISPNHPLLELIKRHRRVLLIGSPGSGKTTLIAQVAAALEAGGQSCHCLRADPGSPGFGPPGTASLGKWQQGEWQTQRLEAICTLDAVRFRLPLIEAVRRLDTTALDGPLLIDAPGVVRGVAGAELLDALTAASGAQALGVLSPLGTPPPLIDECRALGLATLHLAAHPKARHPGSLARTRHRTAAWDKYLVDAVAQHIDLTTVPIIGTPPPRTLPETWYKRQIALLDAHGHTLALGETLALDGTQLRFLAPRQDLNVASILIRDAQRNEEGLLKTARPHEPPGPLPEPALQGLPPTPESGPRPQVRLGTVTAALLNGVYGDPTLHLRLRHQHRSLFFDLGDVGRQPARLAHQVSDVFISHAHFDHIAGFLWLLRSRVGPFPTCRLYGPPGLAEHLAGMVRGILWDRIDEKAPRFEVGELHDERLERFRVEAGQLVPAPLASRQAVDGIVHEEAGFRVQATTLDHGTPVLAYAFEQRTQSNVRKERLEAHGWAPGAWLGELKHKVLLEELGASVTLPDGSSARVGELRDELLLRQPGQRLVYATDFGDTAENRQRLVALAQGADTLFCEASFLEQQAEQARRTGHLTTRACGEIANAANVGQLVPFHFSRRYGKNLQALYSEIYTAFPRVWCPPGITLNE